MTEGAFEARKWGWRQTKEGIVVSFLVHPNDINAALAIAPLGTIYAIGFREMPEGDQSTGRDTAPPSPITTPEAGPEDRERAGKPKRHFSELSRAQQAGIACNDERFQVWACGLRGNVGMTADFVRNECRVGSRADFDVSPRAKAAWDSLYIRYMQETGQMAVSA